MANDHIADDRKKVRLVDANLLMQWVEKLEAYNMGRTHNKPKGVTPEGVRRLIDTMPKVDAVEVVRCKDCKHFGHNIENDTYCRCTGGLSDPEENDFCSYGERRSEDDHHRTK